VIQRKSKDAELAPHVCVELKGINIPGWFDDEGEQISSAVPFITECDGGDESERADAKTAAAISQIQAAWRSTGEELLDGDPYITKSGLLSFIIASGVSDKSAKQYVKPSAKGKLANLLIDANIIKEALNGFVIVEPTLASSLLIGRTGN